MFNQTKIITDTLLEVILIDKIREFRHTVFIRRAEVILLINH